MSEKLKSSEPSMEKKEILKSKMPTTNYAGLRSVQNVR